MVRKLALVVVVVVSSITGCVSEPLQVVGMLGETINCAGEALKALEMAVAACSTTSTSRISVVPIVNSVPISVKSGVEIILLEKRMWDAVSLWSSIAGKYGQAVAVITSTREGNHVANSKHYVGSAVDLRSTGLTDVEAAGRELQLELGSEYMVIVESDHIHVQALALD